MSELKKPEKEEFSGYIYTIYNTLQNEEMWRSNPYVDVLLQVNRNARMLSKALKRTVHIYTQDYRTHGE